MLFSIRNLRGLPFITYAPRGRGGRSSPSYISIVYCMQKGAEGVQIVKLRTYLMEGPLVILVILLLTQWKICITELSNKILKKKKIHLVVIKQYFWLN